MLFGFGYPASRWNFAPFFTGNLTAACFILVLCWIVMLAHAHEGHDDVAPAATASGGLPRLTLKSEVYELVAILDGERMTIYLDRYEDNSPVANANVSVLIDA